MNFLNTGDIVRILHLKEMDGDPAYGWNSYMEQFADRCYEIERTEEDIDIQHIWFKNADKDVNYWAWGSDMVELSVKNSNKVNEQTTCDWLSIIEKEL